MTPKQYLFVCGPARSGTTALTQLLNTHPEIALGIERYKYFLMRREHEAKVSPALFEPDRFMAWSPEETDISLKILGDAETFRDKLSRASLVGDKVPRLFTRVRHLDQWFPEHRMIFIFRDPYRVASSWEVRAQRGQVGWDASRDYREAVSAMNTAFHTARKIHWRRPKRFLVVQYERLFDPDDDAPVRAMVEWLGLDYHLDMRASWEGNAEKFAAVRDKPLADIDEAFVKANTDWPSYNRLRDLAA